MKISINLASQRYLLNQPALKLILSGIILLLLVLLALQANAYLEYRQLATQHLTHLQTLQEQLHGKLPERLTAAELTAKQQAYQRAEALLQRDAFRWTELFDRMEKLLPDGVSLRSFDPDYAKNSLSILGIARTLTELQALHDNLQEAQVQQVYLENLGEVEVDNGRGGKRKALNFSIRLEGVF